MSVGLSDTITFMTLLTIVEQSKRLVTLETSDQSDDLTSHIGTRFRFSEKCSDFQKIFRFSKKFQIFGTFSDFHPDGIDTITTVIDFEKPIQKLVMSGNVTFTTTNRVYCTRPVYCHRLVYCKRVV